MIYLIEHGKNDVAISTVHPDDPSWENNHIVVTDSHTCRNTPDKRLPASTLAGILRNALTATDQHKVSFG